MTSSEQKPPSAHRVLAWVRWGLLAVSTLYGIWRGYSNTEFYTDFHVYYRAGEVFRSIFSDHPLSTFQFDSTESSPFRYAPVFAWIFVPFSAFSFPVARALWVGLGWLCYGLSLYRVGRFFRLNELGRWAILLGTLRFAHDNSNIGQISSLFALLLFESLLQKSARVRGFLLAVACGLKLQPAVLSLVWLWKKNLRAWTAFIGGVGLLVLGSLSFGKAPFQLWIELLQHATGVLDPAIPGNQSLYGFWIRMTNHEIGPWLFLGTLIGFGVGAWRLWCRAGKTEELAWALGLALLPVLGILTWKNTYLLWLFPLAYAYLRRPRCTLALSGVFLATSQGIIGSTLNGFLINTGFLPWIAGIGALVLLRTEPPRNG